MPDPGLRVIPAQDWTWAPGAVGSESSRVLRPAGRVVSPPNGAARPCPAQSPSSGVGQSSGASSRTNVSLRCSHCPALELSAARRRARDPGRSSAYARAGALDVGHPAGVGAVHAVVPGELVVGEDVAVPVHRRSPGRGSATSGSRPHPSRSARRVPAGMSSSVGSTSRGTRPGGSSAVRGTSDRQHRQAGDRARRPRPDLSSARHGEPLAQGALERDGGEGDEHHGGHAHGAVRCRAPNRRPASSAAARSTDDHGACGAAG